MIPHLILVHGMWSRADVWQRWLPALQAAGYATTAIDLPGHAPGEPDSALCGLGLDEYVEAVLEVVRTHERPVLIGHSMGGLIAQQVAMRTELSALVMVSSAIPAPIFPLRPVTLPGTLRVFADPLLRRKSFRLRAWEANYLLFNRIPDEQRPALFTRLTAESGRIAYQVAFGPLNLAGSNRVDKERIACPMLSLAGRHDRIVPASASRRLAAWYGEQVTYREYPDHAHMMMDEAGSDARIGDIIEWLGAVREAGPQRQITEQDAS